MASKQDTLADKGKAVGDSQTMANIALSISILATVVCIFQVLQQYGVSGSPLRLCDSIVYGGRRGLPGKGRRTWVWKQFRFRIIYEIPRISLAPLNPRLGVFVPYLIKPSPSFDWPAPEHKLMSQLRGFDTDRRTGEAAWVSFSRVLLQACPGSVIVNRVSGDADRCPLDMTVIPMPVSMRDMAFFALSIGMECVDASFASQSMTMRGQIGTITSSQHPLLGPVLHYAPPQDGFQLEKMGTKIDPAWILRVCGRVRVGNTILSVGGLSPDSSSERLSLADFDRCSEDSSGSEQLGDYLSMLADQETDRQHSKTSSDYDDEKTLSSRVPPRKDYLTTMQIPQLDWYWLSQIPVTPGFWATPFKTHVKVEICWGAQATILRTLYSLYSRDTVEGLPPIAAFNLWKLEIMCGSNISSFPPYGMTRTGEAMAGDLIEKFARHFEFADSTTFDCHIPKLEIRKASLSPAAHAVLDDHRLCTIDVMSLDSWLDIVGRKEAIYAGLGQIITHVPSIIVDIMSTIGLDFAQVNIESDRKPMEVVISKLMDALRLSARTRCGVALSGAEQMYVLVALLRTVKLGICIGLGNETTTLMEIIRKDIQAHLL